MSVNHKHKYYFMHRQVLGFYAYGNPLGLKKTHYCYNIYGCYSLAPLTVFGDAHFQNHAGQPSLRIQKCSTPIFAGQIF